MPAWLSSFRSKVNIDMIDVLVIGAGISGLLCASELQRAGVSVRVLDKGRGVGGRMATRRMGGGRLDHGAQFFTVREPSFQSYVDEWLDAGVIQEWFRHAPSDSNAAGYPRYCGRSGMTDVAKYLCESLEVHRSQAAVEVVRTECMGGADCDGRGLPVPLFSCHCACPASTGVIRYECSRLCWARVGRVACRALRSWVGDFGDLRWAQWFGKSRSMPG